MKLVVVILVLINVALLAFFNLDSGKPANTSLSRQPMQPEKVKLLTQAEIEALPKNETPEVQDIEQVQLGCYEWGSFSSANLPKAMEALARLSLDGAPIQKSPQEAARYWVYLPKSPSLQAAQAKMTELRAKGVEESFVVFEPQWRYAISLGVFKDEQLAAKLLEDLKSKGVGSAVKGVRNQERGQTSLLIDNMSPDMVDEINRLKPDFPGSELKQVTCQ
jgi:hypothetical protein